MDDERDAHRRRVYRHWRRENSWRSGGRSRGDFISEGLVIVIGAGAAWSLLDNADQWTSIWVPSSGAIVGLLVWECILRPLGNYLWSVPETMYLDKMREVDDAERKHAEDAAEAANVIARLAANVESTKAQDMGIFLECDSLEFIVGVKHISVLVHVDRLVNANTFPVSIETTFCVPFTVGPTRITATTGAYTARIADLPSHYNLLAPIINLSAKQSAGPGYFVFSYGVDYLGGPWFPFYLERLSARDIALRVRDTEMYFQLSDLVNRTPSTTVPAPGTDAKVAQRMKASEHETQPDVTIP